MDTKKAGADSAGHSPDGTQLRLLAPHCFYLHEDLIWGSMADAPLALDTEIALRAIAHPGRRRALELMSVRARRSGELAEACGWSRPAASQQLKVLRDAGLVEVRVHGNQRHYRARQDALNQLRGFLDDFWTNRLSSLDDHVSRRR